MWRLRSAGRFSENLSLVVSAKLTLRSRDLVASTTSSRLRVNLLTVLPRPQEHGEAI
ncbi:MAG: hypothetical protein JWL96_262 [Sphingomonas bacterium]|nr:hypothetical protein [Sphingomonas bacterium]